MSWIYSIGSGTMTNGTLVYRGYSGAFGASCNNPDAIHIPCIGPIPVGTWRIGEARFHSRMGPCAIQLTPEPATETYRRSGFYIHGDSIAHPGHASDGCIILSRAARDAIVLSPDKNLEVVA